MNLFVIPSWYPSDLNPSYGIFIKEQIGLIGKLRPNWSIGVSIWSQGDPNSLLWFKDHYKNIPKILKFKYSEFITNIDNVVIYHRPALSWSKRFLKGNLNKIIRCNELNFQSYTDQKGKPNLILVQATYPGILVAMHLSKKYNVPFHVHVRLGDFMFKSMLRDLGSSLKKQTLVAFKQADLISVTSQFQKKSLVKYFSSMNVLHNPVDLGFFPQKELKTDSVLAIGRLEYEKGFDLLIRSISKTKDVNLKIGGDGSLRKELEGLVIDLNLEDRIEFLGELNREEVRENIQKSKFLILPSRYETFGNVLLEAMACGKPVVATKCGGPSEIVNDKVGLLCDINTDSITNAIEKMIEDIDDYSPELIRAYVEENYSPEVWIRNYESLIKPYIPK